MTPCLDKLDLEHLFRDLPKYKQWISAQSWDEWEEFRTTSEQLGQVAKLSWKLPRLIDSALESEEARNQQITPTVQQDTASMFEKELTSIPKVNQHSVLPDYREVMHVIPDPSTCTAEAIGSTVNCAN